MARHGWDVHREEIQKLYEVEGKTLKEIMAIFERRNFIRKEKTWQAQMAKWGFKKNVMGRGTWATIADNMAKRRMDGKESEVYRDGKPISAKRIQKETRRPGVRRETVPPDFEPPRLPDGIVIRTPGAPDAPNNGLFGIGPLRCRESPFTQFRSLLQSTGFSAMPGLDESVGEDPLCLSSSIGTPGSLEVILPEGCQPGTLEGLLFLFSNNSFEPSGTDPPTSTEPDDTAKARDVMGARDERLISLLEKMRSEDETQLEKLFSSGNPIAEALRDAAFASALRTYRLPLLKSIVKTGVDLGALFCTPTMHKRTPLEFASDIEDENLSLELVEMLLALNTCPLSQRSSGRPSPLQLAVQRMHFDVIDTLLGAGVSIGPEVMKQTIKQAAGKEDFENGAVTPAHESALHILGVRIARGASIEMQISTTAPFVATVTPLGLAVVQQKLKAVNVLLNLGAALNARQTTECFKLHPISQDGHLACSEPVTTTPLGLAITTGNQNLVRQLLDIKVLDIRVVEVDALPVRGSRSPLLIACSRGEHQIAIQLLRSGVDVRSAIDNAAKITCHPMTLMQAFSDATDLPESDDGRVILEKAIKRCILRDLEAGRQSCVDARSLKHAIEAGNLVDALDLVNARTPIRGVVSRIGSAEMVDFLQAWKILPQVLDGNGAVILLDAIGNRNCDVVHRILLYRSDICQAGTNQVVYLDSAVETGNLQLVMVLLQHHAPFSPETLKIGVERQSSSEMLPVELLPVLLSHMPPEWKKGEICLTDENTHGQLNTGAAAAMLAALGRNRQDLFELLLGSVSCSPRGLSKVLAAAIVSRRYQLVQPLIDAGSTPEGDVVNDPTSQKWQLVDAWDAALMSHHLDTVKALISSGADISKRSRRTFRTPVQIAVETKQVDLLQLLIELDADVNAPAIDDAPTTALQYAAAYGYWKLAEMLLDAGANVNAPAHVRHGRTALEGAAEQGRIEVLHLLLSRGALIRGKGSEQFTMAVELAEKEGHNAAAQYLRTSLADG
ncbi:ankyrin repeat-containing domain protein [Podospora aff. communis PSN243]|uniref:Ankyrin repeat-containing domain protein n=1 Tax=Podospora aff. communis PSN243 TaxID=3040156 RepID=A0AAV9GX53_9PEZI|nr:ankyrin repeat-containing domain protein [Podospora aff. communis PSN243]